MSDLVLSGHILWPTMAPQRPLAAGVKWAGMYDDGGNELTPAILSGGCVACRHP